MLPHLPTALLRRLLRWTLWTFATLVFIVVLSFLYITFVGVTVDASALRGTIARTFTDSIGRQVRFDGPMELEISARPRLRVGGLHIANAPGFDGAEFASLGEARLVLDLWPLLFQRRLQVEDLAGSDVKIRLQRNAEGRNNWTFIRAQPAKPAPRPDGTTAISAGQAFTLLDIQRVTLEKLNVEYVGANGKSHYFDLEKLAAQSPANESLKLTLNGTVEKTFPYQLAFTGGPLAELATGKPWPVDLKLDFLSTTLTIDGSMAADGGEITFGLGTNDLSEFERLLQIKLPEVGTSGIAGTVRYSARKVSIQPLSGVMGNTTLTGVLDIDYSGARPKISGSLVVPSLDLRPFLGEQHKDTAPPKGLAELYRGLSTATFSLKALNDADLNLDLSVLRWLSLPGDVREANLQLKLENGRLETPMRATVAGVALEGSIDADATTTPPKFRLALGTHDSDLGGLAELLTGAQGINGHLGRFDLRLSAEGDQVSELVQSLDVKLDVERGRFSYGNVPGGRPVEFGLEKFAVILPAGKPLRGELRGSLLGHPLSAQLRAAALEPMMLEARSPIEFTARSGNVVASIQGMLEQPSPARGPDFTFSVGATRAGEVARWFGLRSEANAPIVLAGKAKMTTDEWRLGDISFQLGRTAFNADLARSAITSRPIIRARLDVVNIDVTELESLVQSEEKAEKSTPSGAVLDIPILPRGIDLTDADIAVRVNRVEGSPFDVRDVSFDGRIREGYMYASPFSAKVADAVFGGAVSLDLRGRRPKSELWISADDVDIGTLLKKLGFAHHHDATLQMLRLYFSAQSRRLGHILGRSSIDGNFSGGRITLRDANTGAEARIAVDSGNLRAARREPVTLDIKGSLDDIPVSIALETATADDLLDPTLRIPFKLRAEAASTSVALSGGIARPLGNKDIELALDMRGTRFDSLDKLVRASLPPWGPWSAAGKFRMSQRGYEVADLRLQVGDSVLDGQGRLDTSIARPRIDISLTAPNIQLDDFKFGDWSPVEKKPVTEKPKTLSADEIRAKAAEASNRTQTLLSPEVLRRQDAYLKVTVDQVLSGKDKLGSGRLEAKLENGRADIGPVEVNIPGGSARLSLGYEPTESNVKVDLKIDADKFDYGILARRIKPETDLRGTLSVNADVSSRARYLSDILKHGSGRIEFAIWPENMQSGIFDLWAVNVLLALVPAVDPGKASKVNCAIGRFELNDGKLVDRTIVLDTSRMRVTGKGTADFDAENMNLKMRPQAKTAQFLSLATPIQVTGPFNKFKISVSPGDILETVGRLATSIIWVPLQKIAGKKIPVDGADVCVLPLDASAR